MNKIKILFTFCIITFHAITIYSQNRENIEKTLYYLNEQLKLKVDANQLINACHYKDNDDIDKALETLSLNEVDATEENKQKVLLAACNGLKKGFADPTDPTFQCNVPVCPDKKKRCMPDEWIIMPEKNKNCQKPALDGSCLEFVPCPKLLDLLKNKLT